MLNKSRLSEATFWAAWLLLAAAFVALAFWATQKYYLPTDRAITFGIQDLYTRPWAPDLFSAASRLGDPLPIGILLGGLIALLAVRGRYRECAIVAASACSIVLAAAIDSVLNRPSEEFDALRSEFAGLFHPRIYPAPDGFASGHVFATVLAYGLTFWLCDRIIPWGWAVVAVRLSCVAVVAIALLAPMYLGTHWFSDAVAGALLALLVLALAWRADTFLHRDATATRVSDLVDAGTERAPASVLDRTSAAVHP